MRLEKLTKEELEKLDDVEILIKCFGNFKDRATEYEMRDYLSDLDIGWEKINSIIKTMKTNDCFLREYYLKLDYYYLNKEKFSLLDRAKINLENKFNITVDYISDKIDNIFIISMVSIYVLSLACLIGYAKKLGDDRNKYANTKVLYQDQEYAPSDIFIVYDEKDVYFCTRKLVDIKTDKTVYGNFYYGTGSVGERYYRKEFYAYYDMRTNKLICQDPVIDFYVERLSNNLSMTYAAKEDYVLSLEELEDKFNIDYFLPNNENTKSK